MNYTEVTLPEVLACREARSERIAAALRTKQCPVVSYTMNIAGRVKNSPAIRRGFLEGCRRLEAQLAEKGVSFEFLDEQNTSTGCERLYAVAGDAAAVKALCIGVEDQDRLSRLFDMDVIDADGRKLGREDLGIAERGCLVCGAPGRGCASRRIHPADEVWDETHRILAWHFQQADKKRVAELVTGSLLSEVNVTPKPGLVDRNNNGSHRDMDLPLFERSAAALNPYWGECFEAGVTTADFPPEETFQKLRTLGLEAEKAMFAATGGVNTHKGAVFLMGILCGAIGRLWDISCSRPCLSDVLSECKKMTAAPMAVEFARIEEQGANSAGGRLFLSHDLRGARGEAADGFPSVRDTALPAFRNALAQGMCEEHAAATALLHLIAHGTDTNMHHRGGVEGAAWGAAEAEKLIAGGRIPTLEEISALDRRFIERNLSPGGCADLLAATIFLHRFDSISE